MDSAWEVAVVVSAAAGVRAAAEAEVRLRAAADMEGAIARVREEVTAVTMMEAPATAQS